MKKKILFIVNNKSGAGGKKTVLNELHQKLDKDLFDPEIVFTRFRGHAKELSLEASGSGVDIVVAVGGDGTVNEVASGLLNKEITMGIIPRGSGNGLAGSLHLHQPVHGISRAITAINNLKTRQIDVGMVGDKPFLSNVGIGFDALVISKFERIRQRGIPGYLRAVVEALPAKCLHRLQIEVQGQTLEKEAFLLNVANASQMGYNFSLVPGASLFDGKLDMTLIEEIPKWEVAGLTLRAVFKRLMESKKVLYFKSERISIFAPEGISFIQVDGEPVAWDKNELEITVLPHALKVLVPADK